MTMAKTKKKKLGALFHWLQWSVGT